MEMMEQAPDKYYELVIVDPPYGTNYLHSGGLGTNCKNKKHNRKWHERKMWDKFSPQNDYFRGLFRVSKNQIIWGANYFTPYLPASMGWIFWDKGQNLSMSDGELAYTSFNKALRRIVINRGQLMIEGGTIHPTQKPIKLYEWLLKNYAIQGDKILDTHGGSMSLAIACYNMGFALDCFEIDTDYYGAAVRRFIDHHRQERLFAP